MTQYEPLYGPAGSMHRGHGLRTLARSDTAAPMPTGTDPGMRMYIRHHGWGLPEQPDRRGSDIDTARRKRTVPMRTDQALARSDTAALQTMLRAPMDGHHPPRDTAALCAEAVSLQGGTRRWKEGRASSFRNDGKGMLQCSGWSGVPYPLRTGPPMAFEDPRIFTGSSVSVENDRTE